MKKRISEWARSLFAFCKKESQTTATVSSEQAEMPATLQASLLAPSDWERIERAMEQGLSLTCQALACKKGGYTVSVLGTYAFLPKSLAHYKKTHTPDRVLGRQFQVYVRSIKDTNILVSHVEFVKDAYDRLSVGDVFDAIVAKILDRSLLVYIPENELYATVSQVELSWSLEATTGDYYPGQPIKVRIIKKDAIENIHASIRQAGESNPYEKCINEYHEGDVLTGNVINVVDFGVFVKLTEGVVGLLHRSEISWKDQSSNLKNIFKFGDIVKVIVCRVDRQQGRIFLSLKRLNQSLVAASLVTGSIHAACVTKITDKDVCLELPYGVNTKIRLINFLKAGLEVPEEGEKVSVQILSYIEKDNEAKVVLKTDKPQ